MMLARIASRFKLHLKALTYPGIAAETLPGQRVLNGCGHRGPTRFQMERGRRLPDELEIARHRGRK